MFQTSITTCSFSNPLWILKSGEVRTLESLQTAGTNANFQFGSSTCSTINNFSTSTIPIMTHGEILISFFLFLLILGSVFSFIIYHFLTKRPAK